jgi:isopenicillin-N epimerase
VFDQYQAWQVELERQPVEFLGRRFAELMREARAALASYVGAAAQDVVFVPNSTTALNLVVRSLHLEPGDEVLTSDHEYGAIDRTWRFVCRQRGATYSVCPVPVPVGSADEVVERLWSAVTPRTRVLALSHITSSTALILPIRELIRRARQAGIVTVIDGAHVPGQLPLDLSELDPDFYAGNCHKWLCSPKGAAFLYARRALQARLQPLVVSWGWEATAEDASFIAGESPYVAIHEWQGTRDIAPFLSVPAAIQFQASHDWTTVRRQCHELARYGRERITALTGLAPLSPDEPSWYAQMVALPLPACEAAALKRRLYDDYAIEIPVLDWNGRQLIRISIQAYNSQDDVDKLLGALRQLL